MFNVKLLIIMMILIPGNVYASEFTGNPGANMKIIKIIESSNNDQAIGDKGKALGGYQLHFCVIQDYNKAHGTAYLHTMAFRPQEAGRVASWYINSEIPRLIAHYGLKDTLENRLTAWNMGISNLRKGKIAKSYIVKYKKLRGIYAKTI